MNDCLADGACGGGSSLVRMKVAIVQSRLRAVVVRERQQWRRPLSFTAIWVRVRRLVQSTRYPRFTPGFSTIKSTSNKSLENSQNT